LIRNKDFGPEVDGCLEWSVIYIRRV